MLDSSLYCNDKEKSSASLEVLRKMAKDALHLDENALDDIILRKIFGLFEKMASSKSPACRESVDVSGELFSLLQSCKNDEQSPSEAELSFISLLAHHITPQYAFQALALWSKEYSSSTFVIPFLHVLLQRGTHHGITREISGTLLRIRHARGQSQVREVDAFESDTNVWRRMFDGSVTIAK